MAETTTPNEKPNDKTRVDEYGGKRKEGHEGLSEEQKFGTSQNPVQQPPTPWSGLKQVGGGGQ